MEYPKPHHNHVPEYQQSSIPFVTSSVVTGVSAITFPKVTRFIVVNNTDTSKDLKFGFTENGVNGSAFKNYYILTKGTQSPVIDVKCTSLFVSGTGTSYSVLAGMTNVDPSYFFDLTGSNGWQGVG